MRTLSPLSSTLLWPRRNLSPFFVGDLFDDMEELMSNMSTSNSRMGDIQETKNHFVVSMDMPGVKKEDIKINIQDRILTVTGQRHHRSSDPSKNQDNQEARVFKRFEQSFTLPSSVDTDKIEAHYEDGVLNVAIPKAESTKPRTIEIKSGGKGFFKLPPQPVECTTN